METRTAGHYPEAFDRLPSGWDGCDPIRPGDG
jgi:hypothetical protein